MSPLAIACANGEVEVVKILLSDPRVDVNKVDKVSASIIDSGIHSVYQWCYHSSSSLLLWLYVESNVCCSAATILR